MTEFSIKQEIEAANRHRPEIAVLTLLLLAGVYSGLAASTFLALSGKAPMWLAALVNGFIFYGTYTVVHEGVHNNIASKKSNWKWLNMTAAFLAAMPLWLLIYPHRASHIVHHTRCNTDDDPDIYARGSFGVVAFWKIPLAILGQFNPLEQYRQCKNYGLTRSQRYFSMISFILYIAIVLTIVGFGFGYELLILWFIPFFIGYALMLVFFTWIPHHPHTITGRYHDTRCSLWPGGNLLTQGQNYHLIHHMMPWVPWYQYERVFHEIRPALEKNHAIIDGFWPRPAKDSVEYTGQVNQL
jgi:beta-carotene hydroxylase